MKFRTSGFCLAAAALWIAGCSSQAEELGPVDPSTVPAEDPEKIKKAMENSMKHLPRGAKMPKNMGGSQGSSTSGR